MLTLASFARTSHLGMNGFHCDCNLLWLADYLREKPVDLSEAKCETPRRWSKRKITTLDASKVKCSKGCWPVHACSRIPPVIRLPRVASRVPVVASPCDAASDGCRRCSHTTQAIQGNRQLELSLLTRNTREINADSVDATTSSPFLPLSLHPSLRVPPSLTACSLVLSLSLSLTR